MNCKDAVHNPLLRVCVFTRDLLPAHFGKCSCSNIRCPKLFCMGCMRQCKNTVCLFLRIAVGLVCKVSEKCKVLTEFRIYALVSVTVMWNV